jgi:hypothetical protein
LVKSWRVIGDELHGRPHSGPTEGFPRAVSGPRNMTAFGPSPRPLAELEPPHLVRLSVLYLRYANRTQEQIQGATRPSSRSGRIVEAGFSLGPAVRLLDEVDGRDVAPPGVKSRAMRRCRSRRPGGAGDGQARWPADVPGRLACVPPSNGRRPGIGAALRSGGCRLCNHHGLRLQEPPQPAGAGNEQTVGHRATGEAGAMAKRSEKSLSTGNRFTDQPASGGWPDSDGLVLLSSCRSFL